MGSVQKLQATELDEGDVAAGERSRITLSTWMRAAHAFSVETQPTLSDLEAEIGISYKTVLRMRDIIKRAAKGYKGHKTGFGAWPRSFMKSRAPRLKNYRRTKTALLAAGKRPSQHTIKAAGILLPYARTKGATEAALKRTECLLRLLLVQPKL